MSKMQAVIVPYWIMEAVQRNQKPANTVLDFKQLRQLVSFNDFATYFAAQSLLPVSGLYGILQNSVQGNVSNGEKDPSSIKELQDINSISFDESIIKEMNSRFFNNGENTDLYEKPYITYDLSREVCGIVINPSFFEKDTSVASKDMSLSLLKDILGVFYVYESQHDVAKHPLFTKYLDLLV